MDARALWHQVRHLFGAALRRERHEVLILVFLMLAAAAAWVFAEIADEVVEGETHAFDRRVLLALRSPADPSDPLGPGWLAEMMRDFTALGGLGVLALVVLAAIGFLLLQHRWRTALLLGLATGSGTALSFLLKLGFDRPRPDLVPHGSIVYTASFPSGHAMASAVVYLTLGALLARVQPNRRLKAYLLALAMLVTGLVGASRVYLGVHWPTDVLAGWVVGALWALLSWAIALFLQLRRRTEREG